MRVLRRFTKPGGHVAEIRERLVTTFKALEWIVFVDGSLTESQLFHGERADCYQPYLPEFIDAVNRWPFEIVGIYNDRHNYYLWSKHGHDRWMQNKAAILERTSIEQWRMLRLLIGGSAALMSSTTRGAGACRVVLELTSATDSGLGVSPAR